MPIRSFNYCARRYADTWSRGERPIFEEIAVGSQARRLAALQRGAGYFRIARNFHRAFDVERGVARLEPVLEVLDLYRTSKLNLVTMRSAVARLRVDLGVRYGGGDKLSAATKFLWLLHREPVVIYDSQARRALGAPVGDYDRYVKLWRAGYQENQENIRESWDALSQRAADRVPFRPRAAPEWFRQRVYDIYLWQAGSQ